MLILYDKGSNFIHIEHMKNCTPPSDLVQEGVPSEVEQNREGLAALALVLVSPGWRVC
jgi:hypothetical protein